jgi:lipoyl-dependent peroxiredoxin
MKTPYQTQATAIGGRVGAAASCDGRLKVRLDRPDDPAGKGTNPEQLFAAGYSACFLSAIQRAALADGVAFAPDSNVTATVTVGEAGALSVSLAIDLPGVAAEEARRLIERAHATCPYSRAIDGNVAVKLNIL